MSLSTNVTSLATRIATEFKTIRTLISGSGTGDVSGLNTTATNLVAAVNEVKVTADAAAGGGTSINDAATNSTDAWSSSKINAEIAAAVNGLIAGAPGALDTLNELAAAVNDDASFASTVTAALADIGASADYVATFNAGLI